MRRCPVCGAAHATCRGNSVVINELLTPAANDPESAVIVSSMFRKGVDIMADSGWKADRRIYLDAEGKAVEADDPNKRTLLVGEGGHLTKAQIDEHGVQTELKPKPGAKAEDKAEEKPAETKHRTGPRETK